MAGTLLEHFAEMPDPRGLQGRQHLLGDMVAIAICAVICGADDWTEVALFGRSKEKWLRTFLRLPHGIPSHDTFSRVFAAIEPEAFERCFLTWMKALAGSSMGQLIAIDGKTLRGSFDRASDRAAIHMVSAWASVNHMCLAQLATEAKSNEITAIPKLLELLDLRGTTVTIDAAGCQKDIAAKIIDGGGDYVLALKRNQPTLHDEVKLFLDDAVAGRNKGVRLDACQEVEGDHGRIETRRVWVTPDVAWCEDREQWKGLSSFAAVECEREANGKTTLERRYFISSLPGQDAQRLAQAVRHHWQVENGLHWVLDVGFHEDHSRIRKDNAAENFSRLRRIALNSVSRHKTIKAGVKAKRRTAGWDEDYMLEILTG